MSEVTGRAESTASTSEALAATTGENLLVSGEPLVGKRSFAVDVATAAATAGRDVLFVTASTGADALPTALRESRNVSVVDCAPGTTEQVGSVTTVSTPGDLTGVSMPVSRFFADADAPVVVVDSISTLLLYGDQAPVFRFLSVLTAHVRRSEGLGLYTIEDGCHDEQTFRTFVQLFDGEVGVRTVESEGDAASEDVGTEEAEPESRPPTPATEVRVRGVADFDGEWEPS